MHGVLFDMDGVLVETLSFHGVAWQRHARDVLKISISPQELLERINGRRTAESLQLLLGRPPTSAEVIETETVKEGHYRELAKGHLKPVAGLPEYLDWLDARQIPYCVVTSAPKDNVDFVLGEIGLAHRFVHRVLPGDIVHGKPHPDPYLCGAKRIGVVPEDCIVHEDADAGVRSGVAAGARVAALTTSESSERLTAAGALWTVSDFREWMRLSETVLQ